MGVFENLPYTNFHELNLDWLIKTVKELASKIGLIDQAVEAAQDAAAQAEAVAVDLTPHDLKDTITVNEEKIQSFIGNIYQTGYTVIGNLYIKALEAIDPADIVLYNIPKPKDEGGCIFLGRNQDNNATFNMVWDYGENGTYNLVMDYPGVPAAYPDAWIQFIYVTEELYHE